MSEIKLVIFDLDGVLVESEIIASTVEAAAFTRHGYEMEVAEYTARFSGKTGRQVIGEIEREIGRALPDGLLKEIQQEIDRRFVDELVMVRGAQTCLERLERPFSICTNTALERAIAKLRKTGLFKIAGTHVYSAQAIDPPAPKPAPDIFLQAAVDHCVDPAQVLVIEDSRPGIEGAVAAGMRVAGFIGGSHSYPTHGDNLTEAGAETIFRSLTDLSQIIASFDVWRGFDG